MADAFDYTGAVKAGHSDDDITAYLQQQAAQGNALEIDPADLARGRVWRIKQGLPAKKMAARQAQQKAQDLRVPQQIRQQVGGTLMSAARDVNQQLPVIGGAAGAALGAPALAAGQIEVPVGGAMLGAAAGKSIQQMLNPLLGQGQMPQGVGDVAQGLGKQAMDAAGQGLAEGVPSQILAPAIKATGNKLMQASIEHGYGDPVQVGQTLLENGIKNSKAGYVQLKGMIGQLSKKHWQGLARMSSSPKAMTFDAAEDYLQPALADLRNNAKTMNFPGGVKRQLDALEKDFMENHSAISPREGGTVMPSDYKPHKLTMFELNAMKEDADSHIRKLYWQRKVNPTEVSPEMDVEDAAYQALAGRARDLMYGPLGEDGVRRGGPAAALYALDQQQSKLLAAKEAIGPQAKKQLSKGAVAIKAGIGAAPFAAGGMMMHANPLAVAGAAGAGALGGPLIANPEALSSLALATQNPAIAPLLSNLIRYIQQAATPQR